MTKPAVTLVNSSTNELPLYFNAEATGALMRQLAIDVIEGETTDFTSRWFRTPAHEADLVIWTDGEKRILKHQLCFYGQIVEWNPINGTRTGLVIEEELSYGQPRLPGAEEPDVSEEIRFDGEAQENVIEQAVLILNQVPELSEDDKSTLIYHLRESPRLHKKARERALTHWAPKIDELTSTRRPTFWARIRNWVLGSK